MPPESLKENGFRGALHFVHKAAARLDDCRQGANAYLTTKWQARSKFLTDYHMIGKEQVPN